MVEAHMSATIFSLLSSGLAGVTLQIVGIINNIILYDALLLGTALSLGASVSAEDIRYVLSAHGAADLSPSAL